MHMHYSKHLIIVTLLTIFSTVSYTQQSDTADKKDVEKLVKREISEKDKNAAKQALDNQAKFEDSHIDAIIIQHEKQVNNNLNAAQRVADSSSRNVSQLTTQEIDGLLQSPDFQTFQQEYQDIIGLDASNDDLKKMAQKQENKKYGDEVDAYIGISMSMPESSIEKLLFELAYEFKTKNVVIALQGTVSGNLAKMSYTLNSLIPEEAEGEFSIVVDPNIFDQLEIEQVPTFVVKTEKGWRKVLGDVSFSQALYLSTIDYKVFEASGPVYEISEPNMLEVIKEQVANIQSETYVKEAKENLLQGSQPNVVLNLAFENRQYLVDPTVTINEDFVFEGVMFAPAGTTINPLDIMPLTESYAFVDLSLPEHVMQLKKWKAQYKNLRVMTTTVLGSTEQGKLMNEYGFISQVNQLIVTRFGLTEIPAIAYQQGNQIRVEVVSVRPLNKTLEIVSSEE